MKHINRLVLILCATAFTTTLFSQRGKYKPEVYLGVGGGMTASMVYFSPTVEQDFLTGYHGGLVFRYVGDKSLGLQVELNYSQRGWSETGGVFERRLEYLELPFLTHFNFGNKTRFFVNLGPRIGYLINDEVLKNTAPEVYPEHTLDVKFPFDYGFSLGFGVLTNIHGQVFQLETRANYSISDIFPNTKSDTFDFSNNLYASVGFSWLIQLK